MKKITITLSDEAEKFFNEYSLPKEEDGMGKCTQSDAINHALMNLKEFEEEHESMKDLCLICSYSPCRC